jgi:ectoine hydroxylase-related dioxygenase (phytanoyl-CoA dioxygenase family)
MSFDLAACAAFYAENGYFVYESGVPSETVAMLRDDATRICRGDVGSIRGLLPTSSDDSENDILSRYVCIHFPHKLSPLMFNMVTHPSLVEVLTAVISPNVKCMQSMLFIKASGKPGQAWHQDEYFVPTRDRSLTGGWIALDDATVENGCLWVIPGSHKHGIIWPTHYQKDMRFDCTEEAFNFPYSDEDAIPVEVKAGTIVFFNGYLLHRSLPNVAKSGYRRALVNHYMSAESLLPWFSHRSGEPAGRADHRDIVLVAGKDPYAYKGTIDVMEAHVRPEKQGGCGNQDQNLISTGAAAFGTPASAAGMMGGAMGGAMGGVMILDEEDDDD